MKPFMDKDFLLDTQTARTLYHEYAAKMPIIDYHCHINPKEIWENRRFSTITEAWLEADHYKWRLMRANGVSEELVTGNGDDREKFLAYANIMDRAIGNPIYHWTHLELQRYFDCDTPLNTRTAAQIYDLCNAKLKEESMDVRGIIKQSNVKLLCTTDDPADTLEYHKLIAEDKSFDTKVLPAWRPEKAMSPHLPGYAAYIEKLASAADTPITCYAELCTALDRRLETFAQLGCVASDHSLSSDFYCTPDMDAAERAFQKGVRGEAVSDDELKSFQSALLLYLGKAYARHGWVMQLHMGPIRNTNPTLLRQKGVDAGGDCIGESVCISALAQFFGALEAEALLPKTILYSMNPGDNMPLASLIGCFQSADAVGKLQLGSAWWFNDTKVGMQEHLQLLASSCLLGNFIGMLTDSRSFLSYTRHEYFRRILCGYIGRLVENGEYPADLPQLGKTVQDIAFNNTVSYFGFDLD